MSKPDDITVTSAIPELHLLVGDSLLRYARFGEGTADFWAKGRWYRNLDGAFITNADGSGCRSGCAAREVTPGQQKWWFRVQMADRRFGWTGAVDSLNPN